MKVNRRFLITGVSALALAAGGTGAAVALGSGEDGGAAKGSGANKAKDAALAMFPGGHANAVERDGENGATWEVELRKSDGQTVDVRLDANYHKVVVEPDGEDAGGN
jgi:peptidase YpeB-like protein